MRRVLAISAPRLAGHAMRSLATSFSTIEVKEVIRNTKCKVSGEADAVKMDELFSKCVDACSKLPGFVGGHRHVCKSEWDYEASLRFAGIENFSAYMESDVREKEILPLLNEAEKIAIGGEIKSQNFVFDAFLNKN